jgi:hypothetical protein
LAPTSLPRGIARGIRGFKTLFILLRFGLFAAFLLRLVFIFVRGRYSPPDQYLNRNGRELRWSVSRHNKGNAVVSVLLATPVTQGIHFLLRQETFWDRVAKAFGISSEFQTGDRQFDGRVFIVSEEPLVHDALAMDVNLREGVNALTQHRKHWEIYCDGGWLYVQYRGNHGYDRKTPSDKVAEDFANGVGDTLGLMGERVAALGTIAASAASVNRERHIGVFSAVCLVLGVVGLAGFVMSFITGHNHQVVFANTHALAKWVTAGAAVLLLAWLFLGLSRTSRTHSLLVDVLLAALPGVWFATVPAASWYNQNADLAAPTLEPVWVETLAQSRGGKGGPRYYVTVRRWPDPRGEPKLKIAFRHYTTLTASSCALAIWHRGALGDGWISGFAPDDGDACGKSLEAPDPPALERY